MPCLTQGSWCSLFWCFTVYLHQGSRQLLYAWRSQISQGETFVTLSFFSLMFRKIFFFFFLRLVRCYKALLYVPWRRANAALRKGGGEECDTGAHTVCTSQSQSWSFLPNPPLMLFLTAVQFGTCGLRLDIHSRAGQDHGSGWWCASRAPSSLCNVM